MSHTVTQDHSEIRLWAKRHRAVPAENAEIPVDSDPRIIQFIFPDAPGNDPRLEPISWEDFFARFDMMNLALQYEKNVPAGSARNPANQLVFAETKTQTPPTTHDGH